MALVLRDELDSEELVGLTGTGGVLLGMRLGWAGLVGWTRHGHGRMVIFWVTEAPRDDIGSAWEGAPLLVTAS